MFFYFFFKFVFRGELTIMTNSEGELTIMTDTLPVFEINVVDLLYPTSDLHCDYVVKASCFSI